MSGYATYRDLGLASLVVAAIVNLRTPLRFNRPLADRAANTSFFSVRLVCDLAGSDMIESVAKFRRENLKK
jgi:uncharacterized protein (DUF2336 family)